MRRRYFIIICPAVLIFGILCGEASAYDVKNGKNQGRTARSSSLYPAGYEKGGNRSNRDIISRENRGYEYYREKKTVKRSVKTVRPEKKTRKTISRKAAARTPRSRGVRFYKVRKGDTLFSISRKFDVNVRKLESLNKLGNKNRIFAGMKLKIPADAEAGNEISKGKKSSTSLSSKKPLFKWPVTRVKSCRRDGSKSVKSIGIVIKSRAGEPVMASERGVVKRIGYMRGYGNYVVIKHSKRYITVYSNMGRIRVNEGENVSRGGIIGSLDNDRTLHFQIDYAGKAKNPLEFLPARG